MSLAMRHPPTGCRSPRRRLRSPNRSDDGGTIRSRRGSHTCFWNRTKFEVRERGLSHGKGNFSSAPQRDGGHRFTGTDLVLDGTTTNGQGGGLFNEGTAYLIESVLRNNMAAVGAASRTPGSSRSSGASR